ncbi:MAG: PDDEXK nuclease domain-containing protein [Cytophagaceae bacterium]|jgi:predicted nuclease of restriction endonuclease-like (RecB) superfamily|nr:PDDEXK nuclease domain-containing protein [Cytophagaceae bacterium]
MANTTPVRSSARLLQEAIRLLESARVQSLRQTNHLIVFTYFQLGKLIVEHEQAGRSKARYGNETLEKLSRALIRKFGKGFSVDNLEHMRSFYLAYQERDPSLSISEPLSRKLAHTKSVSPRKKISEPLSRKSFSELFPLSWSNYVLLSRLSNSQERSFYEIEAVQGNWGKRELQRQIDSGLFERLSLSKNKKQMKALAARGQVIERPEDLIKAPYILDFLGLEAQANFSESDLESAIIGKIEQFLLEMGKGFLFGGRQVRFSFDGDDYFVDLVLYNRLLRCFVLVDLKIGKLKHQDLGQMQMYVNYYDRFIRTASEHPTIGIIICKDKSDAMVEITLPQNNKTIFAKEYKLYLPTKNELLKLLKGK